MDTYKKLKKESTVKQSYGGGNNGNNGNQGNSPSRN